MSMLMIFSCMAVSASAEDEGTEAPATPVTIQIPAPVCEFDQVTMTISVAKPSNIHYPEDGSIYYPVAITATAGEEEIDVAPNEDGSYTISDVELEKEYTVTATIVDDTNTVAGTKSTTVTPAITVPGTKDICEFDEENRTILVDKIDNIIIGGSEYAVGVVIEPAASSQLLGDGSTMFFNLDYGTKYTVKAYVAPSADSKTYYSEDNFEVTVDQQQSNPVTPVPTAITSKSITITAEKGVEYTINNGTPESLKDGKTTIVFDGLEANTSYTISAQKPASEGFYASEKVSITVTTKKAATKVVPILTLEDKSNTSITVKANVENVEYRLNNGAWQNSGEFKNLKADTQYNIYARVKAAADQEESPVSEALIVKTNAAANYEASEKKISFSCTDGQYANTKISFTVTGDGPADINKAVFGDTKIVPVSYKVVYGEDTIKEGTFADGKVSVSGDFTPAEAYAEKSVTVTVIFETQKFKGIKWETVEGKNVEKDFTVKIGRIDNAMTKITEFFEMIANFLFNTVPAFLADAMKSDVWGRIFKLLGSLGGVLGG